MEFTLWAYQVTPPHDDTLHFAQHEADCRRAALEQRAELKANDPEDYEELGAMALYFFVFRSMSPADVVAVLNGDVSLIEACAVERKLVGMIAD